MYVHFKNRGDLFSTLLYTHGSLKYLIFVWLVVAVSPQAIWYGRNHADHQRASLALHEVPILDGEMMIKCPCLLNETYQPVTVRSCDTAMENALSIDDLPIEHGDFP